MEKKLLIMLSVSMVMLRGQSEQNADLVVFTAQEVITMNPMLPKAQAVAVKDGKIVGVGTLESLKPWLDRYAYKIDDRFAHEVIVPGFIEAHMHPQITGLLWSAVYVGKFDRYAPDGTFEKGMQTKDEVLAKIKKAVEAKSKDAQSGWVFAWGYQPEFFDNSPLTVEDLDPIAGSFDIMVENASMHIFYVSSSVLKKMGATPEQSIPGVVVKNGKLTGELEELQALKKLLPALPKPGLNDLEAITRSAAKLAHRSGVTTVADAALGFVPDALQAYKNQTEQADFPVRVVVFPEIDMVKARGGIDYLKEMHAQNNERLSFGPVKFVLDGSLQGYTANLKWPYYLNGKNGISNMAFDTLKKDLLMIHEAGYQAALHANGDQATQEGIDAIKYVLTLSPRPDHRHRLEHNQLVNEQQLMLMKASGIATNLFVNHVYYWGDLYPSILGNERAMRIDPAASALHHGVRFSFHSDASVTPVDPLKTIWIAATRRTMKGKVLGADQRISVYDALKAVTLDAAYLLFQDAVKGSIEIGKLADFTVLDRSPLDVLVDDIPNIKVRATVLGGKVLPVEE